MGERTLKDIEEYVLSQHDEKINVLSVKPETEFYDLGETVRVWNVKTDTDTDWWVVEGDELPMNLYTQSEFYFSTDEVYSFHVGLMNRMFAKDDFKLEMFIVAMTHGTDIAPILLRKLKVVVDLIDNAMEIEDFQSIGVQCREILIELGNSIYVEEMCESKEQPQASNFKMKAVLYIKFYLPGSENKDYRKYIKNITDATWDYAAKIIHSRNTTMYEANTCVTLCTSLVAIYENINQKIFDPISQYKCKTCNSKKLKIVGDELTESGIIIKFVLQCEECNGVTEVIFEQSKSDVPKYIKGKVEK